MKIMKGVFYITIIFFILVACRFEEEKIKNKFITKIEKELKLLQEKEMEKKDNPKCVLFGLVLSKKDEFYFTNYFVLTGYEYDIIKTDSIVSPYTAKVRFKGISYVKEGKTLLDCLNNNWKTFFKEPGLLSLQQKYTYQDGGWVLKETER